jgi:hypothetical protein
MRRRRSEEQRAQFSRDGAIASNDFGELMIKRSGQKRHALIRALKS